MVLTAVEGGQVAAEGEHRGRPAPRRGQPGAKPLAATPMALTKLMVPATMDQSPVAGPEDGETSKRHPASHGGDVQPRPAR